MTRRDDASAAVQRAAIAHLVHCGPCDEICGDTDEVYCEFTDCTYCALARAVQAADASAKRIEALLRSKPCAACGDPCDGSLGTGPISGIGFAELCVQCYCADYAQTVARVRARHAEQQPAPRVAEPAADRVEPHDDALSDGDLLHMAEVALSFRRERDAARHNYDQECAAFYAFREEMIAPLNSIAINDPSALLDEFREAMRERGHARETLRLVVEELSDDLAPRWCLCLRRIIEERCPELLRAKEAAK